MKKLLIFILVLVSIDAFAQKKTIAQIKSELQKTPNPIAYVRDTLKKRYKFDTIMVTRIRNYTSIADSLAYHGQIKKVYGPYDNGKILVQVLAKLPNTFYRVGQIFLDTSVFRPRFADSIANNIIQKIKNKTSTFEELAQTYSMGGEGITKGDLGWVAKGVMIPEVEKEIAKHKKGEVFKVWTKAGVHIIRKTENPKQDYGVALMMRVFL
ncbi:MAG TPA: peptidylprolyl isomerase [Chitinophagaceae bacterium]|nr:peptidylprolyl isomerase [Chitinophagaceae bacterium]